MTVEIVLWPLNASCPIYCNSGPNCRVPFTSIGQSENAYAATAFDVTEDDVVDPADLAEAFRRQIQSDIDNGNSGWQNVSTVAEGRLVLSHDSATSLSATRLDGVTAAPVDGE